MVLTRALIDTEELVSIGLSHGTTGITFEKRAPFYKDVATLHFNREQDLRHVQAVLLAMDVDVTHAGALSLEVYLQA